MDYWSNFFELDQILGETTSVKVIQCLRRQFSRHGIPDTVITDNGPQFSSDAFSQFSSKWMFRHITTSPYHAQSNGMVESSVKIAKNILRTSLAANEDPWLAILSFRDTPTTGMSTSPVQRLMSRRTKTLLPLAKDLLLPDPEGTHTSIKERELKQSRQVEWYNKRAKDLPALKEGMILGSNHNISDKGSGYEALSLLNAQNLDHMTSRHRLGKSYGETENISN